MNAEAGSSERVSRLRISGVRGRKLTRSWQFFQQGTTPLDTQRRQLELFAEHVLPAVR